MEIKPYVTTFGYDLYPEYGKMRFGRTTYSEKAAECQIFLDLASIDLVTDGLIDVPCFGEPRLDYYSLGGYYSRYVFAWSTVDL
jgi:hypothetical protein